MKIYLALFSALCCQPLLHAQSSSNSTATTSAPAPEVDKTELMLRRLRESMGTAPPASAQPAPAPKVQVPTASAVGVQPQTPSSTGSTVPATAVTQPAIPELNATQPAVPSAATTVPVPNRSLQTAVPTVGGIPSAQTGAVPPIERPQTAPGLPPRRTVPTRVPPTASAPQPNQNPAAMQVPGGGLNLPGASAPTAAQLNTNSLPVVTVSTNYNPNEIIQAGTFQLQGMEPDQFFDSVYSPVSGRTVIRNYTVQGLSKITLKAATDWTRQEAVFAMDAVLAQNGVAMIPIGDKFVKAVAMANAATEGGPTSRGPIGTDYGEAEAFITQVVKLDFMKPTDLQQLLSTFTKAPQGITAFDTTQTLVIRDYASNVKRMLEVIKSVDVAPKEPDYKLEAIPVKYGKVIDLYTTMQSLISGSGGAAGAGAAASGQASQMGGTRGRMGGSRMGGMSGGYGGGGGYGGMSGGYGGGGYGGGGYGGGSSYGRSYGGYSPYDELTERLSPQQVTTPTTATGARTSVGGAQASFQNRLNQIVKKASGSSEEVQLLEDARIVPDERSNKLLVFANPRDMAMITNIVAKVDELLAQVLIEAVIMEVRLGDSYKLGVNWAQQPKSFGHGSSGAGVINNGTGFLNGVTNFPSGTGSGFSYFGTIANDWSVAINAVAANNTINVVSRPRIQTSHAIPGSFFVGETVPYITGVTDYGGLGVTSGLTSRSSVQQARVGFSLFVTPFITPEGLVVMEISQEFSTRGADVIIDNNPIPIINDRNAESTLTVRDGDTIMMGGFITENRSKNKSGVPFLKDIPGVGALFRSRNDDNNRAELIVLMRARVLRSPEDAAIVAAQERNELPGVRQAEQDLQKANEKRQQKVDKYRK